MHEISLVPIIPSPEGSSSRKPVCPRRVSGAALTALRSGFAALAFVLASATIAAAIPDTGQDTCYNDTAADTVPASNAASVARDAGTHPGQDCRYGRDAAAAGSALPKIGGGAKGFDYTKIANNGAVLASTTVQGSGAGDWACTRDNITGLTWEVKSATATNVRYFGHTYTWYDSNPATNGGIAGTTGANTCSGTLPGGLCNTQAYNVAVNAAALCTYTDWRMPTIRELYTLADVDNPTGGVDPSYFPDMGKPSDFWSATSYGEEGFDLAWMVSFQTRVNQTTSRKNATTRNYVRLVRGAPF